MTDKHGKENENRNYCTIESLLQFLEEEQRMNKDIDNSAKIELIQLWRKSLSNNHQIRNAQQINKKET